MAETTEAPRPTWIEDLVEFLRTQPAVKAIRVDPDAQKALRALGYTTGGEER